MVTSVDICNMALSYLGDRATLSSLNPPEGSAQADHCARFYPLALNQMLESYAWSFALRETPVAATREHPDAYALPSDCLRLISVRTLEGRLYRGYQTRHIFGQKSLISSSPVKSVLYITSEITESDFSALFADALARLLASKLAGAMVPGSSGQELSNAQMKFYEMAVHRAMKYDAMQSNETFKVKPLFTGDFVGEDTYAVD